MSWPEAIVKSIDTLCLTVIFIGGGILAWCVFVFLVSGGPED